MPGPWKKPGSFRRSSGQTSIWRSRITGFRRKKRPPPGLRRLAQETGIPLAVTNDAHYIRREDAHYQDVLMCIQTGKTLDDPNRMRFETQELYLKSEEEMRALFPDLPEACDVTGEIADKCRYDFSFGRYHLPEFRLPPGETDSFAYLQKLCREGFAGVTGRALPPCGTSWPYELNMIRQMGFVDYFLIVADFVNFAKSSASRGTRPGQRRREHGILYLKHYGRGPGEILPVLRTFPEPGTGEHAGHRYGLLRPPPGRGY